MNLNIPIRPLSHGKKTKLTLLIVAFIIIAAITVDQITPRPFIAIFRALIGSTNNAIQLGPYEVELTKVEDRGTVSIPVDGLPPAKLTFYTQKGNNSSDKPLILYIHGGGWVTGTASAVADYAKLLASHGYVVANLEYSLAPEYKYPAAIHQSMAALNYLETHAKDYGADSTKLFIAGNSAGAQMSAQLGAIVTNEQLAQKMGVRSVFLSENLKGLILFNGVFDFGTVGRDRFPGFDKYAWSLTGKKDYKSYSRIDELSTVRNITSKYPPVFLTAGDADPIEPQTYQFDAVLRAEGIDVTSLYWTGSGKGLHHDYMYQLDKQEARVVYEEVLHFIDERIK